MDIRDVLGRLLTNSFVCFLRKVKIKVEETEKSDE